MFTTLTKAQKSVLRSTLFQHLDGIVVAPTVFTLLQSGLLSHLLDQKSAHLDDLATKFKANKGYLNVALRVLCAQGWFKQSTENQTYSVNDKSDFAVKYGHFYEEVVELMKFSAKFDRRKFDVVPFRVLEGIMAKFQDNYGVQWSDDKNEKEVQEQILKHIEGCLIGPSVVALGMNGMFHKYFMEASFRADEFHSDAESFGKILDFFSYLGWFEKGNETYRFTDTGLFFAKRASAYGVTVSYIPTFRNLDNLIFGDPKVLWNASEGSPEKHVDREMNVWGSGGAHAAYFKKVDEILIEIFNRPIHEQPRGVLDMGCGNGAFLQHIFEVIATQTHRGELLDDYPLFLVGADYNQAALKVTRKNLIKADIWAKVLWGDIGRPALLAETLRNDYRIELEDLLNVRSFLDHNRPWETTENSLEGLSTEMTGAYAYRGEFLKNELVAENLKHHLQKWAPYAKKFGLLIIELHTLEPPKTAQNLGKTAATAYDATHGFSDQYIVELDAFLEIAELAGLKATPEYQSKFPNSDLATVSINLFKGE